MEPLDLDDLTAGIETLVQAAGSLTDSHFQPPEPYEIDATELMELRDGVDGLTTALDDWRETWTRMSRRLQRYVCRFDEVLDEAALLLDEVSGADP